LLSFTRLVQGVNVSAVTSPLVWEHVQPAAARRLLTGAVDAFASDYVPNSLVEAAFQCAHRIGLPQAVGLVTEKRREARRRVEARGAQPINGAIDADQRRGLRVADQRIVFKPEWHALRLLGQRPPTRLCCAC
jgi:hypothetical protein